MVPTLFAIEVGSVLVRNGAPIPAVRAYVDRLLAGATVVPLGPRAARQARDTAMRWALRAADAVYVWIAARDGAPLCTLDRKLDQRAGGACEIIGP